MATITPDQISTLLKMLIDVVPNIIAAIQRGETQYVLPLDQYDARLKITKSAEDVLHELEGK